MVMIILTLRVDVFAKAARLVNLAHRPEPRVEVRRLEHHVLKAARLRHRLKELVGLFERAPQGSVFTFTVVRRPFLPGATKADVPLTTVMVELDDAPGVRLVARLADGVDPRIGMRVTAVFEHHGEVDDVRFTSSES